MRAVPEFLLDANLLIGAFLRGEHPVLRAAAAGRCRAAVCPYVVREARRMIRRAFPGRAADFDAWLRNEPIGWIPDAAAERAEYWSEFVSDLADGPVLAAAIEAGLTAVVTSDRTFRSDARATLSMEGDPIRVLNVREALAEIDSLCAEDGEAAAGEECV